jgi:hypothetical protein
LGTIEAQTNCAFLADLEPELVWEIPTPFTSHWTATSPSSVGTVIPSLLAAHLRRSTLGPLSKLTSDAQSPDDSPPTTSTTRYYWEHHWDKNSFTGWRQNTGGSTLSVGGRIEKFNRMG